jgi:hypothetical protein
MCVAVQVQMAGLNPALSFYPFKIFERDYDRMAGMILGDVPDFDAVIYSIKSFETIVNDAATQQA